MCKNQNKLKETSRLKLSSNILTVEEKDYDYDDGKCHGFFKQLKNRNTESLYNIATGSKVALKIAEISPWGIMNESLNCSNKCYLSGIFRIHKSCKCILNCTFLNILFESMNVKKKFGQLTLYPFCNFQTIVKEIVAFLTLVIVSKQTFKRRTFSRNIAHTEAVVWTYSLKNVSLKIAQNLQENTCAVVPFQ